MTTITSKYSNHADRWISWDAETGEVVQNLRPTEFARRYGLTSKQEFYTRYGVEPGLTDEELVARYETPTYRLNRSNGKIEASFVDTIDTDWRTNPSLLVPGETSDAANDRVYGRPLPAGVSVGRPA